MRAGAACLLCLLLACCGPSSASAKRHKKLSSCQKLSKHHKDRASSRKLVVVVRGNEDIGDISGCVLPRGRVRTLAEWDGGWTSSGGLVDTAGTWVLVYEDSSNQFVGSAGWLTRIEVRRDKRTYLSEYKCVETSAPEPRCSGMSYGRAQIAPSGAGALELIDHDRETTTLNAFNPAGAFTPLAAGAVDALSVTRTHISWTQLGSAHKIPLPE